MADYDWFDREPKVKPDYELWGFQYHRPKDLLVCPKCRALILPGTWYQDIPWIDHIIWHDSFEEGQYWESVWPVCPSFHEHREACLRYMNYKDSRSAS